MSDPLIKDVLNINPRFLRSVQLERDFNTPEALSGYCVTTQTSTHLKRLGSALGDQSAQRAWRITGDFGSGKSSFALLLANLVGRNASEIPKDVRRLRNELGLARNAKKLLPVLITGSREPLARAVLRTLKETLSASVDGRKRLKSIQALTEYLEDKENGDKAAISILEQATCELIEKEICRGVFLIIDELGKFLEYAALHPDRQDIYFLQLLGEAASRSGKNHLTVVGLLHQGFAVYADKLSESSQKEWEKIAGRFEELVFNQPLNQIAQLLAKALNVSIPTELRGWKTKARAAMANAVDYGAFGPDAGKTALCDLAPDLYPLHPTVLPVLTKFFRRFGQNERSLFSFILSSEPFALRDFASQAASSDSIYKLSDFFDFAAHNFSHRLSNQSFRSHWNHVDAIVRSTSHQPATVQAIIKTIGILNVVESVGLTPTEEFLSIALDNVNDLGEQLKKLSKQGIVFNRGRAGYSLWPHSSVNLDFRYQEAKEQSSITPSIAQVVSSRIDVRPVVARGHYIRTGNLRHCSVQLMLATEFIKQNDKAQFEPKHPADGSLTVVLCNNSEEQSEARKKALNNFDDPQCLFAISPPLEGLSGLAADLELWRWIERHTPELKDDRFAAEEVNRQITTLAQLLDNRLEDYLGFRFQRQLDEEQLIEWISKGASVESLNNGGSLQLYLSNHFDTLFDQAPLISNELVNRHSISSAAAAARQQLFKRILNNSREGFLGLPEKKAPPEKSLYLSVLSASNLHTQVDGMWQMTLPEAENDPQRVLPAINAIIGLLDSQPDSRVSVSSIQHLLRKAPYGVKDGLIPIFYSVMLKIFENEIAVYEDGVFKPEIDENLMMVLAKRPETFEFQLCRMTGIRRSLLESFATAIEDEAANQATILAIVKPLCLFIDHLPEYTKRTHILSQQTLNLRDAIQRADDPARLVFEIIPHALGYLEEDVSMVEPSKIAAKLSESLRELRRCYISLLDRMSVTIIGATKDSAKTLDEWRSHYAEAAENLVVEIADPRLRAFCLKLIDEHTPNSEWLESLGSFLVRLPPNQWKDKDENEFSLKFAEAWGQFERTLATCYNKYGNNLKNTIRLAITHRNGNEIDCVVAMESEKLERVSELQQKIARILQNDSDLAIQTLSKALWEHLQAKQ